MILARSETTPFHDPRPDVADDALLPQKEEGILGEQEAPGSGLAAIAVQTWWGQQNSGLHAAAAAARHLDRAATFVQTWMGRLAAAVGLDTDRQHADGTLRRCNSRRRQLLLECPACAKERRSSW